MKRAALIFTFAIIGLSVMSCGIEPIVHSHCPSYSHQKRMTKHGNKAQAAYIKKNKKHI